MIISKFFKRLKRIIKVTFITLLFLSIIIFVFKINMINSSKQDEILSITEEENLIKEIRSTSKIIPLEIELSKSITIDKSWGNLELFQKYTRIKFFANCSFFVDLSNIKEEDIIVDKNKNIIDITIPNPQIFTIDIIREKTIYEDSSNGLLRFGEIMLTSKEFEAVQKNVYKSFEETLNQKDIYEKAIYSSKISLTNLLEKIIGNDININISFK